MNTLLRLLPYLTTCLTVMYGASPLRARAQDSDAERWMRAQESETGSDNDFKFENPLVTDSITELLYALLRIIMVIAVPIVVFFIIYAGFLYVTARGNAEQLQTATRALTYAIIGGLIMVGATVIVGIVANLVDAFLAD